ncbi:hypothetical protein [Streptomyces sp. NPDC047108]|uniref:hypothetical protein n=1 Tax=Streptomyces sp. NPDC047108 TaxID=3155025 RepID=UPI0034037A1F
MRTADTSRSPRATRLLATATALTATLLLGACGEGSDSAKDEESKGVASVTSPKKGAEGKKKPAATEKEERPLLRGDASDEEHSRLWDVYYECLAKEGVKVGKNRDGDYSGIEDADKDPKFPEGQKKCGQKEPEMLSWRSARIDPDYREKADTWLKCLNSHGIKATADDDGMLALEDGLPPQDTYEWLDKCEVEAFTGK